MIYDCIIVGGGPAGLTASIYANRAGLNCVLLEKIYLGGQITNTYEVDNYPGLPKINGAELALKFDKHAKEFDLDVRIDEILAIEKAEDYFSLKCKNKNFDTKTVIISTGAKPRLLDIEGESEFSGKGVSYCATCDGSFFKNKTVAVLGSGNTAVEDAIFLSRICKKVYLISRSQKFKSEAKLLENAKQTPNIELMYNYVSKQISGEQFVNNITLINKQDDTEKKLQVDGIFVAVGIVPNSGIFGNLLQLDEYGYIKSNSDMSTNVKGIFVAGDVRNTPLRQVVTAASDGAIAAYSAKFLYQIL